MEEKKSEKLNDKELDKVSGGWQYDMGRYIFAPGEVVGSHANGSGSPTNNTLRRCPVCVDKMGTATHEERNDPDGVYKKSFENGKEYFTCYMCCRMFWFEEDGTLIGQPGG